MKKVNNMKQYEITLMDAFSFAVVKRTAELTENQLKSVLDSIDHKTIVYSKLIDGIHWQFVPVKITELTN